MSRLTQTDRMMIMACFTVIFAATRGSVIISMMAFGLLLVINVYWSFYIKEEKG